MEESKQKRSTIISTYLVWCIFLSLWYRQVNPEKLREKENAWDGLLA